MENATLDMITLGSAVMRENTKNASNQNHGILEGYKNPVVWKLFQLVLCSWITQAIFLEWRRNYFSLFQKFSFLVIWLMPILISLNDGYHRFIFLWILHAGFMGIALSYFKYPLTSKFDGFYFLHQYYLTAVIFTIISSVVASILFIVTLIIKFEHPVRLWGDLLILLPIYGVYFSLITRNIVVILMNDIEPTIKRDRPNTPERRVNNRRCFLCNDFNLPHDSPGQVFPNQTCRLSCGHQFHQICCSVWCFIGKQLLCPRCRRIIILQSVNKLHVVKAFVWCSAALDSIEYCFVWFPAIVSIEGVFSFIFSKNLIDMILAK